ncbi:DUF342 domain-containing protein [Pontibacillus yanchengensis]|uniref:DUF342 domain-containing protein n=2 Tax=Pontibacillus yanchengensis TaxID=462910 RepID=A0ACC7VAY1_9BACI|nr:FapA family protein [Pontibacillus yanchengensis]MYL33169.1 DUF342 domain-containing protein [Pontibacillus yanchengensis]MYL51981.1 DUF342 domain-containing protein [Pontibacillus yanchengensis]
MGIEQFEEFFSVKISSDKMKAMLYLNKEYHLDISFTEDDLIEELVERSVTYGIQQDRVKLVSTGMKSEGFPVVIAEGTSPQHGQDGTINYEINVNVQKQVQTAGPVNFREVMEIPSVHKGDKLLTVIDPTVGKPGKNVINSTVYPKKGKPVKIKAGKNVEWNQQEQAMYSTIDGQVSVGEKVIHVYPYYEVSGDIDMRTGNLDFVGTIVIRGNVPNGYKLKADGDIKVYGLVESAVLLAGGSIYVSEGIAASSRGEVKASLDVQVGYVNQGNIEAGRDIIVENSILHSHCIAREHIYCEKGSIIGGSLSAGTLIQGKDIGNRMSTTTELFFGVNKKIVEKEQILQTKQVELKDSIKKLTLIGEKLNKKKEVSGLSSKERITLLRQRNSLEVTEQQLNDVEEQLESLGVNNEENPNAQLMVNGTLHSNTYLSFGKYKRHIIHPSKRVKVELRDGEISILSRD